MRNVRIKSHTSYTVRIPRTDPNLIIQIRLTKSHRLRKSIKVFLVHVTGIESSSSVMKNMSRLDLMKAATFWRLFVSVKFVGPIGQSVNWPIGSLPVALGSKVRTWNFPAGTGATSLWLVHPSASTLDPRHWPGTQNRDQNVFRTEGKHADFKIKSWHFCWAETVWLALTPPPVAFIFWIRGSHAIGYIYGKNVHMPNDDWSTSTWTCTFEFTDNKVNLFTKIIQITLLIKYSQLGEMFQMQLQLQLTIIPHSNFNPCFSAKCSLSTCAISFGENPASYSAWRCVDEFQGLDWFSK